MRLVKYQNGGAERLWSLRLGDTKNSAEENPDQAHLVGPTLRGVD